MNTIYMYETKRFKKDFNKIPKKIGVRTLERLSILIVNPFNPILNIHQLNGEYLGFHSMNITGDYRLIFKLEKDNVIELHRIGTHSQLYKK